MTTVQNGSTKAGDCRFVGGGLVVVLLAAQKTMVWHSGWMALLSQDNSAIRSAV